MLSFNFPYSSLEDYLIHNRLTIDYSFNDGFGAQVSVKGRKVKGSVLFADISDFSGRTKDMHPEEVLMFVNHFFTWVTAQVEGHCRVPFIVDKYIGDEVMLIFSEEFGSENSFWDALKVARWIAHRDLRNFHPHIGIASGEFIIGYTGTPKKYNCSAFGSPVTLAKRCSSVKPEFGLGNLKEMAIAQHSAKTEIDMEKFVSKSIGFPASEWDESFRLDEILGVEKFPGKDGKIVEMPLNWELKEPREVEIKNLGKIRIRELVSGMMHISGNPEMQADVGVKQIYQVWLNSKPGACKSDAASESADVAKPPLTGVLR